MKSFLLLFFMSGIASADLYTITPAVPRHLQPASISAPQPTQDIPVTVGFEVAAGSYQNVNYGPLSGFGILGEYKVDRHWLVDGRLFIASSSLNYTSVYYDREWWGGQYYWSGQNVGFNEVDLTVGPLYRLSTRKFSPVAGVDLGYGHRYFNTQNYGYNYSIPGVSSDVLFFGPTLGLDYRIAKDVSLGLALRYEVPSNGPTYYLGGLNLKFSF